MELILWFFLYEEKNSFVKLGIFYLKEKMVWYWVKDHQINQKAQKTFWLNPRGFCAICKGFIMNKVIKMRIWIEWTIFQQKNRPFRKNIALVY